MVFLDNLDFLLKAHNMKRADLARAIHVAPSTINSFNLIGVLNQYAITPSWTQPCDVSNITARCGTPKQRGKAPQVIKRL